MFESVSFDLFKNYKCSGKNANRNDKQNIRTERQTLQKAKK